MLMQPQDHTLFPNRIPLVGSRNIWQDLVGGRGGATMAQPPSAASGIPSIALSLPLNSLWVAWLVTQQAPSASDQERAAVVYPRGLDGASGQEDDHEAIESMHLGARGF